MPTVSIILPTYNRERFLPEAFAAIAAQTFTDWELIVVDDGSTDNTRELVPKLTADFSQSVRYIHQENQGAYGARNTGLDYAQGKYIAFYDSDDLWLPHHLQDCVEGLEANPDVDWVYGACRMVDYATGEEIVPSTFYVNGEPRPFLKLNTRRSGNLRIFSTEVMRQKLLFRRAAFCGFQNSVLRATCFAEERFETKFRNEAEDSLFLIRHVLRGGSLAYLNNVHVIYNVHDGHSSAAGHGTSERQRRVLRTAIEAYDEFAQKADLKWRERKAFERMLARICFWHFGYSILWRNGERAEALKWFERAIIQWPFDIAFYKTYLISRVKHLFSARKTLSEQVRT